MDDLSVPRAFFCHPPGQYFLSLLQCLGPSLVHLVAGFGLYLAASVVLVDTDKGTTKEEVGRLETVQRVAETAATERQAIIFVYRCKISLGNWGWDPTEEDIILEGMDNL